MLKLYFAILILFLSIQPISARTNAEIGAELYNIANVVKNTSQHKSNEMKENIAKFLIEANIIGFDETKSIWVKLPSGWLYDKASVKHYNLRHIGIYKSNDNKTMGIFDVNCEDINDPQNRFFGYVATTEVYFTTETKRQRGHSKGFYKTFCK